MEKTTNASEYLLQFINECYKENSINHIMETAYKYLGNPCTLHDASYKVLSYFGKAKEKDQIFNDTVNNEYLSPKVLNYFVNEGLLSSNGQPLYQFDAPIIHLEDEFASKRIGIAILSEEGKIIGWFATFETNRKFNDIDPHLVSWLAKIISPLLSKPNRNYLSSQRIEDIIIDIINGINEPEHLENYLESTSFTFPTSLRLITISDKKGNIPEPIQVITRSYLNKDDLAIFYRGHLLLLSNAKTIHETIDKLVPVINKLDLIITISQEFSDITKIKHYYMQNIACTKIGLSSQTNDKIYWFENYTSELLLYFASRNIDKSEYENPILKKVKEYDKQHNTDYYRSLKVYIIYGNNLKKAANELKIHRNTLNYRIAMIEKIFNLNLYNQNLILKLHLAFAIDEINKASIEIQV